MTITPEALTNLAPAWQPGKSGNPGGKPVGARNRLQGDFMRRLADDFNRFGIYAIARMRHDDPGAYVRAIASLMPKELEITRPLDDIPDEQLQAAFLAVGAILAAQHPAAGDRASEGAEQAEGLPAVPEAG